MDNLLLSSSLTRRAYWLVELRWVAIAALIIATAVSNRALSVSLPSNKLYLLSAAVFCYNIVLFGLIRFLTSRQDEPSVVAIGRIITFQISMDLVILTTILHLAGGIENPFSLFFVFHMIIAGILRSRGQSYLQATLAVLLFGSVVLLECYGQLRHYPLEGFATPDLYTNRKYVLSMLFVFSVTLYLIVYMTTSIAEQLRAQQESLEQANLQLEEKDEINNQYVLRVTHDIKGHLAAIESLVNIVNEHMVGPLNEKQQDLVGRAHRRTVKCMEFIQALLKITRMKLAGKIPMAEFSLQGTLEKGLEAVQDRAQEKSIRLSADVCDAIDRIFGEPIMMEETITNMLFNAVKYTPEGGRVQVKVEADDPWIRVLISDTGIGIPAEDIDQVFSEFFRASNARATERDGTGLGLSFAKTVVERHGGQISVRNNEMAGCTFEITLPLSGMPDS